MFNPFHHLHWITLFPDGYPWYKKILANMIYFLTGIVIHPRHNLLTHQDLIRARWRVRRGDIFLCGNLREVSSILEGGIFTHAALYVGRHHLVEAVAEGVRYNKLHHFFTEYDTLAILRIPPIPERTKIIRDAVQYAQQQVGKPYDFDFSQQANSYFCTELVNFAFRKAGYHTKLNTMGEFRSWAEKIEKKIIRAIKALHPDRFVEGNFEIVFLSHNLRQQGKKVVLTQTV